MSLREELEVIKELPLFSRVDPARLKLLAFASDRLSFADGAFLFRSGDQCDGAYVILEGEVEILTGEADALLTRLGPSELFGEIAMICNKPRTASVRALGTVTVLRIPTDVFMPMLTEFPEFAIEVAVELARRLEWTIQQLAECRAEKTSE